MCCFVPLQAAADASQALSKVAADLSVLEDMDLGQLIAQVSRNTGATWTAYTTSCHLSYYFFWSSSLKAYPAW
jgi:hypothetical protein